MLSAFLHDSLSEQLSMSRPLTKQQQRVYDFVREKILERGYGPTVREIGDHMEIKSPNGVLCHLRALEQKGVITRKKHQSRAIELTEEVDREPAVEVPVAGILSRTRCHLAAPGSNKVDFAPLFHGDKKGAVRVQDDSLVDIQIQAGDVLIVAWQTEVRNGQLAIVSLTGPEGSLIQVLRQVHKIDGQYHLHGTNRAVPTTTVDRVEVVGVVQGVVRSFD